MSMEVAQFDTNGQRGPFLFYFQMDYDIQQEGVVGLALSKYDRDFNSFSEIGLFTQLENQSLLLKVIQPGVYVVSIQPIASSKNKFTSLGKQQLNLEESCFTANCTYLIETMSQAESSANNPVDLVF